MKNHQLTQQQIQAYAHHLQMEEKSGATMEKYLRDIRAFVCWLDGRDISKELTSQWKSHLVSQDYAPTTVNAMLSALNSLLEFLALQECRVKFLKIQRRLFRDANRELTKEDYQRLLTTAHKLGRERLELLVQTIGATGIRVSEVQYITVEAVQQGKAEIALKGKIRTILLPGKLCRKLLKYAKKHKTASGAIFRTRSGKELGRRQIWAELKGSCASTQAWSRKKYSLTTCGTCLPRSSTGPAGILQSWPTCWATAASKPRASTWSPPAQNTSGRLTGWGLCYSHRIDIPSQYRLHTEMIHRHYSRRCPEKQGIFQILSAKT